MTHSDRFFTLLRWAVERKDFEDFWPVGLETTGPRYWPQLAIDLEEHIQQCGKLCKPDFPTANVALAFCLIYGAREMGWSLARSRRLFEEVFSAAQITKVGDLFNSDGANCLWNIDTVIEKYNSGTSITENGILAEDIYELSGQILALAESEYFMNHRIATEKHGPYIADTGEVFVVRSVKNLCPVDLWPELKATDLNNHEFHIIFKYRKCNVKFDVLSNLLTPLPAKENLISITIVSDETWDYPYIRALSKSICKGIEIINNSLNCMTKQEKSERMTQILYFGCRSNFDSWREKASNAILVGRGRSISFPVPKQGEDRLRYYDLSATM